MANYNETGIIEKTVLKKTYEETQIEWRIPDITKINEITSFSIFYNSPSFFINDASCHLMLYPKSAQNSEFMRLLIATKVEQEFSTEYNISLKKLEGSLEYLVSGIPKKPGKRLFDMGDIIKRSQLIERKSELAPHDVLTIICRFKRELSDSTEPSDKTMPVTLIRLDKLSENLKAFFGDKETCDVTLKVQDKEYKAHRSVLMARSRVFAANFKHDTLEKQTGVITIPDCDPESFQDFLDYLYSGKLEEISYRSALNLYYTSNKYDVEELKVFCVEYLLQCLTVENICEIAVFADQHDETQLYKAVQEFFNENSLEIFLIPEWEHLLKKNYHLVNKLLMEMSKTKLKK